MKYVGMLLTKHAHTHLHCVIGEVEQPEAQNEGGSRTVPRPSVISVQISRQLGVRFY